MSDDTPHYPPRMIAMLEAIWGEGFLSPGGPEEVARVVGTHSLAGLSVLDIGCGAGGIDVALASTHGAGYVCGIDVEDPVLTHARALVARHGLGNRIGLIKVAPGPLDASIAGNPPKNTDGVPKSFTDAELKVFKTLNLSDEQINKIKEGK